MYEKSKGEKTMCVHIFSMNDTEAGLMTSAITKEIPRRIW